MITVSVTKNGYYVAGEGIEAAMQCSPATDERGNPIFHELHHTYKVLFLALKEVARKQTISGDVIVYSDSRIIDELNGLKPLDDVCEKWLRVIRRELLPGIRSIVIFRKKNIDYIKSQVRRGGALLTDQNPATLNELAIKIDTMDKERARSFKARALDRFKRMWNNDKHE